MTVFESREEREAAGRPVDPKWMQEQNVSEVKLLAGSFIDGRRHGRAVIRLYRSG
jgi:hypothetical protein